MVYGFYNLTIVSLSLSFVYCEELPFHDKYGAPESQPGVVLIYMAQV